MAVYKYILLPVRCAPRVHICRVSFCVYMYLYISTYIHYLYVRERSMRFNDSTSAREFDDDDNNDRVDVISGRNTAAETQSKHFANIYKRLPPHILTTHEEQHTWSLLCSLVSLVVLICVHMYVKCTPTPRFAHHTAKQNRKKRMAFTHTWYMYVCIWTWCGRPSV